VRRGFIRRTWSRREVGRLIALRRGGRTELEIARRMCRSFGSVHQKIKTVRTAGLVPNFRRRYTAMEDAIVRDRSLSAAEVARRLGRTPFTVQTRRSMLGATVDHRWSREEIETLLRMRSERQLHPEIARALGRTRLAVAWKAADLVHAGRLAPISRQETGRLAIALRLVAMANLWPEDDIRRLLGFWKAGSSVKEVAAAMGRTMGSIQWRLGRLRKGGRLERLTREEWHRRVMLGRERAAARRREVGSN